MVRAGSDMCLDLFHLLQGFLVYALLKKAEEAAAVAVARAGAAVMVSTRGGGGEFIFHFSMLLLAISAYSTLACNQKKPYCVPN